MSLIITYVSWSTCDCELPDISTVKKANSGFLSRVYLARILVCADWYRSKMCIKCTHQNTFVWTRPAHCRLVDGFFNCSPFILYFVYSSHLEGYTTGPKPSHNWLAPVSLVVKPGRVRWTSLSLLGAEVCFLRMKQHIIYNWNTMSMKKRFIFVFPDSCTPYKSSY